MDCSFCMGTGRHPGSISRKCAVCGGKGFLPNDRVKNPECRLCMGTGRRLGSSDQVCDVCQGWGRLPSEKAGHYVVFVEAGKPRTVHLQLEEILKKLSGQIRICDPYYGTGSLHRLDLLTNCEAILFLTQHPDTKEKAFLDKALAEFVQEHPAVEFRLHSGKELHDRFILTGDELILLGHGLKDIGKKESFVIRLNRDLVGSIIDDVRESFDKKWQSAEKLVR